MTRLLVDSISVEYGVTRVLSDFSIDVGDGEFLALLGPSGCGKTTILKAIAGLLDPAGGDILFDGKSVLKMPPELRSAAMVFQKPLLFPHLSVAENVAFGLKMRQISRKERLERADEALKLVQLEGMGARKPSQLSGGQEQRVALARALITAPGLLLLDEPFSALDEKLRREMRQLVRDLQRRLRITTIFVTHDQDEAVALADRIALLLGGRLEQVGTAKDFYTRPHTAAAGSFFGWNLVSGRVEGGSFVSELGEFKLPPGAPNDPSVMAFRSDGLQVGGPASGAGCLLQAEVIDRIDFGQRIRYRLRLRDGREVIVDGRDAGVDPAVFLAYDAMRFF